MTAGEVDYYGLDELLGEEERMTRASVRSFVEREVLPVIERCHSEEQFPRPLIARMGELGFFGANLKGYGCAGLSNGAYGLIMQELEAGDSGLRSMASVQGSLAMFAIWRWGSEEQKQRWLPAMASGRAIGCFGLTEPDHGSDPGGMETRARRDGSGYVLSGVKRWITNGSIADVSVVWAKDGETIRGFLVERGTPGFSAHDIKGKFSLRASITSEITKGQLLAWRLGKLKDAGTMRPEQVSLAKRNNVSVALDIARLARDILGANGIVNEYPVIRHMMNLETVNTYEGTYDMHTLIIGRDITGLDAIR